METVLALPILFLLATALTAYLYSFSAHYLVDHWVYETSWCLAKETPLSVCKKNLFRKMGMLPLVTYQLHKVYKNSRHSFVELHYSTPIHPQRVVTESLRLPITIQQLRRSQ